MSTATRFKYHRPFPDCLVSRDSTDTVGNAPGYAIGNLSLASVMAFFWNLETFTFTFVGTDSRFGDTYDFGQTATVFPPSASQATKGKFYAGSLFPAAATSVAFASLPQDPVVPKSRVCSASAGGGFNFSNTTAPYDISIDFVFSVFEDSAFPGKYGIYYELEVLLSCTGTGGARQVYFQNPNGGSGGTLLNSGTFTLGGISFPYESYHGSASGETATGGTMSATSSDYTY